MDKMASLCKELVCCRHPLYFFYFYALASQNGSVAPPRTLQKRLTNGVILPYPDETRYTPSSCPDAQKSLWTPWCQIHRKSAILSGTCVSAPFLPISTPRIWSNSSYTFHATGFKLGQVTLQSWGTKSCTNLSRHGTWAPPRMHTYAKNYTCL